jgi:5-methylcytosine-specific restriction endonuclease McrA
MGILNAPVLVVNQNYEPLNICDVKRAVVLLDRGKAELILNGRGELQTPSRSVSIPSVIRLSYLVKRPFMKRRMARREVFYRDNYTCQYCGKQTKELTIDHVVPRLLNGPHTWENVVSACIPCNHSKAARTPKEAGMKLLREPRAPRANPYGLFQHRTVMEEWLPFLPWTR